MNIYLERNEKYGAGYQLHVVVPATEQHDGLDDVVDFKPYNVKSALKMAEKVLEITNQRFGTDYDLKEVLVLSLRKALPEIRADIFWADVKSLTPCEVVVLICMFWKEYGVEGQAERMKRFCEYVSFHGYNGGSQQLYVELADIGEFQDAIEWIREHYSDYVENGEAMMEYVL